MESARNREILRAMSQENVEIVTRAISAAIARPKPDYSTVNELYAPDHVLVPVGAASGIEGEGKGAEGFRAWRREIEEFLSAELVVTVRGGQVVRTEAFMEPVRALRAAAGLSE